MNKRELLDALRMYLFYALDLNLYLDNYPDNNEAKADYNIISKKLIMFKDEYEKKCGPLINFGLSCDDNKDNLAWTDGPWPWENRKE